MSTQLQPFRRPNPDTAALTREWMLVNIERMRGDYVNQRVSQTPAPQSGPKPGDLHEWSNLVDGCVYADVDSEGGASIVVCINGDAAWVSAGEDPEEVVGLGKGRYVLSAESPRATVIASGLQSFDEIRKAIDAYMAGGGVA